MLVPNNRGENVIKRVMIETKLICQRHKLPAKTLRHLRQPRLPFVAALPFSTAVPYTKKSAQERALLQ